MSTLLEPCEDDDDVDPPSNASGVSGACDGIGDVGVGAPGVFSAGAVGCGADCSAYDGAFRPERAH